MKVLSFVRELSDLLPAYEMCCEHEHSNCVLIAHKKVATFVRRSSFSQFLVDNRWHTWIDYTEFHKLVRWHTHATVVTYGARC